ncbi:MAG: formimidoylglutamate deiminase [Gammaproteobacteria bacterium]|nr:formimidoylglutamate deiminase [Gammaproteobacteria bacterium]
MRSICFENLWVAGSWCSNATLTLDDTGAVRALSTDPAVARAAAEHVTGLTLPGLANAHCHAFQRALGGWTQRAASVRDDFWSWREIMYAAAAALTTEDLEAIAARCYLDLLRGGYTQVAEFLYLHRLRATDRSQRRAEDALLAAAAQVGIGLTLLPALYQSSGFGPLPPTERQRLFVRTAAQYVDDWHALRARLEQDGQVRLGIAFHSLRAVDLDTLAEVHAELSTTAPDAPVHLHIAEQRSEVEDCIAHHGLPPVALLASRALLDERWALVHATHATAEELASVAASGATVVLCPTTEADLGDGCSEVAQLLAAGGQIAIGSDSNVACQALGELRQLEWSERLRHERRNVLAGAAEAAVADRLYAAVLAGGWGAIAPRATTRTVDSHGSGGQRADFITYDAATGDWAQHPARNYLASLVFASTAPTPRDVMVGGRWVIRDGHHAAEHSIDARYRATLRRLAPPLARALEQHG